MSDNYENGKLREPTEHDMVIAMEEEAMKRHMEFIRAGGEGNNAPPNPDPEPKMYIEKIVPGNAREAFGRDHDKIAGLGHRLKMVPNPAWKEWKERQEAKVIKMQPSNNGTEPISTVSPIDDAASPISLMDALPIINERLADVFDILGCTVDGDKLNITVRSRK